MSQTGLKSNSSDRRLTANQNKNIEPIARAAYQFIYLGPTGRIEQKAGQADVDDPVDAYILNIYNWDCMETVSLPQFEGFDWDEGNVGKNWESHRVTQQEAEQVFFNRPLIVADDVKHSEAERRYYVLGQTDEDRALFVAFTVREERIRVISARDMSRRERKVYQG